jgi:TonB family protein
MGAEVRVSPMSDVWTQWEGQMVNGTFPLRRCLGISDHSGVFLTEHAARDIPNAALKLVPLIPTLAESQLSHWSAAAAVTHPNLIRLFEMGRCQLGSQHYLYVVMDYAEQNLAHLLQHRPLSEAEVREMLPLTLDALTFLHTQGLVQGQLKPSNVLVVGNQLKLASDTIRPADEATASIGTLSLYNPPEARDGSCSTSGDIWALGVTLCQALTTRLPSRSGDRSDDLVLPPDLPVSFVSVIRRCLIRNPAIRPSVGYLRGWLNRDSARQDSADRDADSAEHELTPHDSGARDSAADDSAPRGSAERDSLDRAFADRDSAPRDFAERDSGDRASAEHRSVARDSAEHDFAERDSLERASADRSSVEHDFSGRDPFERASAQRDFAEHEFAALDSVEARSGLPPAAGASPQSAPSTDAKPEINISRQRATPPAAPRPEASPEESPPKQRSFAPLALAAVVLVAIGWGAVHFLGGRSNATAPTAATETSDTASPTPTVPGAATPLANGSPPSAPSPAESSTTTLPRSNRAPTVHPSPRASKRSAPSSGRSAPSGGGTESASVVHEELPSVPLRARQTIHGHVKVAVLVTVNNSGVVVNDTLNNPGPSRYFARLASEAAKKWKFMPAPASTSSSRRWLVRFEFSREGTKAHATPAN